jgi:hypothetical protein
MTSKSTLLSTKTQIALWCCGSLLLIVAMVERSFAFFAGGARSIVELVQILMVFSLCTVWPYLKPKNLDVRSIAECLTDRSQILWYQVLQSSSRMRLNQIASKNACSAFFEAKQGSGSLGKSGLGWSNLRPLWMTPWR